jgi:hypothetical protein
MIMAEHPSKRSALFKIHGINATKANEILEWCKSNLAAHYVPRTKIVKGFFVGDLDITEATIDVRIMDDADRLMFKLRWS